MKRTFTGSFSLSFEIEIEQSVFDAVDDSFREHLYNLQDDEDIVEHIASCLLRGMNLSQLDGWANHSDLDAFITSEDWQLEDFEELP